MSDQLAELSKRERQVVALVSEGPSNKVIARTLNVSEGTIKVHLHAILQTLGVGSRYALLVAFDRAKFERHRLVYACRQALEVALSGLVGLISD